MLLQAVTVGPAALTQPQAGTCGHEGAQATALVLFSLLVLVLLQLLLHGRLPGQSMLSWTGTRTCCSYQLAVCGARAPAVRRLSPYAWLQRWEGIFERATE
jgi:hypothetical protein